ncbi:unnamed protein product [Eretmochelys imbricata]
MATGVYLRHRKMTFDENFSDELYYKPYHYGGWGGSRGYGYCRPWYYRRPYKCCWGYPKGCWYPYPCHWGWGHGFGKGWPCFAEEE